MKSVLLLSALTLSSFALCQQPDKPWKLEIETGLTSTRYNDARVPKATGSNVDLAALLGKKLRGFGRVTLSYDDRSGGTWKLLYAPFRQSGTGTLNAPASFDGQTFGAGQVGATYQFNSYRLTYRKRWKDCWSIGGTLKIRDAEIRLQQGGTVGSEKNVGVVPLLNIFGEGSLGSGFEYEVELDGLAGGPGRAIDLSLRLRRPISPTATAFVGYRVLEGGADIPRVRNFAWVNYITVGISFRF